MRWAVAACLLVAVAFAIGCPNPVADTPSGRLRDLVEAAPPELSRPAAGRQKSGRGRAIVAFKTPDPQAPVPRPPDATPPQGKANAKDREPLFQGWPTPKLAFAITGQQHGYIEPCGCTGLTNQKGGMARRHTLFKQLRAKGWPLIPLDVGGQVRRPGPQAETKFKWTSEALFQLGYKAVTYGVDDLLLSSGELAFPMLNSPESPFPFVCCNVSVISSTPTHRIIEQSGLRIGITGVLGSEELKQLTKNPGLETRPVDQGLKDVWQKLSAQRCNFYILLAHASVKESREIAKRFPHFHLVVTTGLGEPEKKPEEIRVAPGKITRMVQAGNKAMYVGVLGLFDNAPRVRYERVSLSDRFDDSPEMRKIMKSYQAELKDRGLKQLGAVEVPHYSGRKFVGSEACKDCHSTAYEVWAKTPHAHATDTLVDPKERSDIARHFDPECLSCHVTGWAPQEYTPYASGYLSLEETPHLKHSGCENCHGPGHRHVEIENGDVDVTEDEQNKVRLSMRLPKSRAKEHCIMCHDLDNSPDFFKEGAFERYWKAIEHIGKD